MKFIRPEKEKRATIVKKLVNSQDLRLSVNRISCSFSKLANFPQVNIAGNTTSDGRG